VSADSNLPQSSNDGWVGVSCYQGGCTQGAEYVPHVGPGAGWIFAAGEWWCSEHAQAAHDSTSDRLHEELGQAHDKVAAESRERQRQHAEARRLRGWIESYRRDDWQHTREDFCRMALTGYEVPPVDDRLVRP
jgi:hypothetical protein